MRQSSRMSRRPMKVEWTDRPTAASSSTISRHRHVMPRMSRSVMLTTSIPSSPTSKSRVTSSDRTASGRMSHGQGRDVATFKMAACTHSMVGKTLPGMRSGSLRHNNFDEVEDYFKHRATECIKDELCASGFGAANRGKLSGVASENNMGDDCFEHQHAHIENNKLGAKTHQAETNDASSNMLRLGTEYHQHQGRLTVSSSSADGWHM